MQPVTPNDAIAAIAACAAADLPAMLWGPPGVGKSQMVRAVADAVYDGELIDIRLSQYDPAELGGLPVPDLQRQVTTWLADQILPGAHSAKRGILFLDEITSAPQMMQAAAYQIILDRGYRGHKFPSGWYVCAAGNRTSDRGVAFTMPAPLANRFTHLILDPSDDAVSADWHRQWCEWASAVALNPLVSAFIQFRPQALFSAPQPGVTAFPTPRAWESIAKHLDAAERQGAEPNRHVIMGTVGPAEGMAMLAFLAHRAEVASPADVITDPARCTCPTTANLGACFFAAGMCAGIITPNNAAQVFRYVARLPDEIAASVTGLMSQAKRLEIGTTRAFQDWLVKYQSLLAA